MDCSRGKSPAFFMMCVKLATRPVTSVPETLLETKSQVLDAWAYEAGVRLNFIRPGKPVENAYSRASTGGSVTSA